MIRTFKIYPLSKFQKIQHINYSHYAELYPMKLIYFIPKSLTPFSYFACPLSPASSKQCVLYIYEFVLFLDFTYKWDHMVFTFLCLTCFISYNAHKVHPCYCKWKCFIFYGSVIVHIVCIYKTPSLTTYISVESLGGFQTLVIVCNAAVNTGVHISF